MQVISQEMEVLVVGVRVVEEGIAFGGGHRGGDHLGEAADTELTTNAGQGGPVESVGAAQRHEISQITAPAPTSGSEVSAADGQGLKGHAEQPR